MGFIKNALGMIGDAATGRLAAGVGSFVSGIFGDKGLSKKDQMEIIIGPRTMLRFINTFNPITLEDKLASFKTNEEAWAWVDSLKATGKQIYLIDWNDPVNATGGTELRLIQVIPGITNRPLY